MWPCVSCPGNKGTLMQNVYRYSLISHWFYSQRQNREGLLDIQIRTFKHTWKSQIYGSAGRHTQKLKANVLSNTWVSVKMLVCPLDDLAWSCHFVIFPMTVWALWEKSAEYEPLRPLWTVMNRGSAVEGI